MSTPNDSWAFEQRQSGEARQEANFNDPHNGLMTGIEMNKPIQDIHREVERAIVALAVRDEASPLAVAQLLANTFDDSDFRKAIDCLKALKLNTEVCKVFAIKKEPRLCEVLDQNLEFIDAILAPKTLEEKPFISGNYLATHTSLMEGVCPECEGTGTDPKSYGAEAKYIEKECPHCKGLIANEVCAYCHGVGKQPIAAAEKSLGEVLADKGREVQQRKYGIIGKLWLDLSASEKESAEECASAVAQAAIEQAFGQTALSDSLRNDLRKAEATISDQREVIEKMEIALKSLRKDGEYYSWQMRDNRTIDEALSLAKKVGGE